MLFGLILFSTLKKFVFAAKSVRIFVGLHDDDVSWLVQTERTVKLRTAEAEQNL
jgi:hypothetical protein